MLDHVFPSSPTMLPGEIARGAHTVVVMPAGEALGAQDVLQQTVNVFSNGLYPLSLAPAQDESGADALVLELSQGDTAERSTRLSSRTSPGEHAAGPGTRH